jgi:regulator of sigma E protease
MLLLYILVAILMFGSLIFIHELGHFLTARLFQVTIYEFSIGMGPKLVSWKSKKNGTAYSLRMLPIGGFVSMAGEDEDSDDEGSLRNKKVWQRMIITAAGSVFNLLIGLIVK